MDTAIVYALLGAMISCCFFIICIVCVVLIHTRREIPVRPHLPEAISEAIREPIREPISIEEPKVDDPCQV